LHFDSSICISLRSFSCGLATISVAGVDKSNATLSLLLMGDSFSFAAMSTTLEAF